MEKLVPPAPGTARDGQTALIVAITEAVHDGDDRTVRRLLARFAEVATIAGLYALRDALIHGERPARTAGTRNRSRAHATE